MEFKAGKISKDDYIYIPWQVLIGPLTIVLIACAYFYKVVYNFVEAARDPVSQQAEIHHE